MEQIIKNLYLLCCISIVLQGCDLFGTIDNKDKLPPATQKGNYTFGCLVNGNLWLQKGNNGTSNLDLSYDPEYAGGLFDLLTYRYSGASNTYIRISADSLTSVGTYRLNRNDGRAGSFSGYTSKCQYYYEKEVYRDGYLTITKFDLKNLIISGTFEFTLYTPDCDTIKFTQGRFDMKI